MSERSNTVNFSEFKQISMSGLKTSVGSLKTVSGGTSGVSTKIFKDAFYVMGNRMLDIINASLNQGVFPQSWKTSVVLPIPKVTNSTRCDEFCPINTVPVYEKLLEVTVKDQLLDFCEKNDILVPNQSGFRRNHSCESVVMNICSVFANEMDNGNYVLAVFLDFKRAFETINRDILLIKLEQIGLNGSVLKWFKSYLDDTFQVVKFREAVSKCMIVKHGVPQGTILGTRKGYRKVPCCFLFISTILQKLLIIVCNWKRHSAVATKHEYGLEIDI